MTFSELKTLFANKYGETSAPATGAEVRNRFINRAIEDIAGRRKWTWLNKDGSLTTDGTSTLSLPTDFSHLGLVKYTLKIGDEEWTQIFPENQELYSDDSQVFYITGNPKDGYQLNFPKSIPDSGQSVAFQYYHKPTDLSDDDDICVVPNGEAVASLAVGKYFTSEGDYEEGTPFLQEAEQLIDDMISADIRLSPRKKLINDADHYGKNVHDVTQMY